MSTPYTVKYGDTLTLIARRHGFGSWKDLYYHDDNRPLRAKRPDPDKIYPGDVVMIPGTGTKRPGIPLPPTPPVPVPPEPPRPELQLSTRFALIQPGDSNEFMDSESDFFFRVLDLQNPHVPQIYWLGPLGGYKRVRSKVTFNNQNYARKSYFNLTSPGRDITDLGCEAYYMTRYKKGHRGLLSQVYLLLKPHPVIVKVPRPYPQTPPSIPYNAQRRGVFQRVENPGRYVIDNALPDPFL